MLDAHMLVTLLDISLQLVNKWSLVNSIDAFKSSCEPLLTNLTDMLYDGPLAEHKPLVKSTKPGKNTNSCPNKDHEYLYSQKTNSQNAPKPHNVYMFGGTPPPLYSPIFLLAPLLSKTTT